MGEFICVCAIDMCEIKPAEVSVCCTRTTGWSSPSPTYYDRGGKGMQENDPRWLGLGGERGRSGLAGWGWFIWGRFCFLACGPIAPACWGCPRCFQWGCYLFFHVSLLLHSSCLTYINSHFVCMEWDFWEAWNDKTGLCFPARFPPRTFLRCLPRLPAPSSHPTEPGAKLEKNTQRIQFTNRNKHLFGRFYIIIKQNQGRKKKKRQKPTTLNTTFFM